MPERAGRTVDVPAERLAGWLARFADRHGTPSSTVDADGRSVLLTAPDGAIASLDVPFPPLPPGADLVDHVTRTRTVGVLLVRRGGYAAGVFAGRRLLASKVGSAYVQGRTKAGGWSQQRFARRRANQARDLYDAAAAVAAQILLPRLAHLDAVISGGDKAGLADVLADPRLEPLRRLVASRVLAVADPRLAVLAATPEQFLAVRVTLNDRA
jgi:Actinobacteria/chloroflexi VLRF1 release factor